MMMIVITIIQKSDKNSETENSNVSFALDDKNGAMQ